MWFKVVVLFSFIELLALSLLEIFSVLPSFLSWRRYCQDTKHFLVGSHNVVHQHILISVLYYKDAHRANEESLKGPIEVGSVTRG